MLYDYEEERIKDILKWIDQNLDKPTSFSRSSKPRVFNTAISWYKDTAKEHITYMRELATILEGHGISIEVLQTEKPGYIVYEDNYQITADPFTETNS